MSAFTEQQGWRALYYIVTKRPSFASSNWETLGGTACVAGQYHDGTACQSCPMSTYNTESNCTSGESCCDACQTGKYSKVTGAINEYSCEYCEMDNVANCQRRLSAGTCRSSAIISSSAKRGKNARSLSYSQHSLSSRIQVH